MGRRRILTLALLCGVAACSGPPSAEDLTPDLLDVWVGLGDAGTPIASVQGTPCDSDFGTWFPDFGVRGLACVAAQVVHPRTLLGRAGGQVFESGPHTANRESFQLDLSSERDFGRYNRAFVAWMIDNGIVGEGRPALRALTQPIYDGHLRQLARIYLLTFSDMAADGFPGSTPAGILSDYASFLAGGPIPEGAESYEGGFSVLAFTELSETIVPRTGLRVDNEWTAKYEANTAYGFWLRRRSDGTIGQWRDGLIRLLETYDAEWLSEQNG